MMEKEIICVICPSSCRITVSGDGKDIQSITGYTCQRGKEYAENEYIAPKRTLTTTIRAEGYVSPIIPVRSNRPLPKEQIFAAKEKLRKAVATPPFYVGKVIVENILDTGVDIVLTNQ